MTLYIVVAVWESTKNNHAGMLHFAEKIKEQAKFPVKIIKIPTKGLHYLFIIYRLYALLIGLYLRFVVKKEDTVWLMEYLLLTMEQSGIARMLKGKANIVAIAHLIPSLITRHFSKKTICKKISYLNHIYVLGSSLKNFFISQGVPESKIINTFHYVDNDYYVGHIRNKTKGRLSVICMGNMQRNYEELKEIIRKCQDLDFIVCMGNKNLANTFSDLKNVKLVGFIPEDDLRDLMNQADISLNVMNDTIGSNVITTSLSMGLPVIASNVGSISDYITGNKNGMLFNNTDEAISCLKKISEDRLCLSEMSKNALDSSENLSVKSFCKTFFKENRLG